MPASRFPLLLALMVCFAVPGLALAEARTPPPDDVTATDRPAVTLYVQDGCGYCARARQLLEARGVAYTERNIAHAEANADWRALGGQGVPLLTVGETRVQGFDQTRIEAALASLDVDP